MTTEANKSREYQGYYDAIAKALDAAEGMPSYEESNWQRDGHGVVICRHCGNSLVLHRIDTKAMKRDQGDCPGFEPGEVHWRERRWARVRLPE